MNKLVSIDKVLYYSCYFIIFYNISLINFFNQLILTFFIFIQFCAILKQDKIFKKLIKGLSIDIHLFLEVKSHVSK